MAQAPKTTNNNQKSNTSPKATTQMKPSPNEGILQPLGADDKYEQRITITGDTVKAATSFKFQGATGKDDPQYLIDTTYDFSGCSREELLQLAMRSARISFQALLRKGNKDAVLRKYYGPNKTIDVKSDIIDAERPQGDENARLIGGLARKLGISKDDAEKLLAKLPQQVAK